MLLREHRTVIDLSQHAIFKLARSHSEELAELVGQMCLIREASISGDDSPARAALKPVDGRCPDSANAGELLGSQTDVLSEPPLKLPFAESNYYRD